LGYQYNSNFRLCKILTSRNPAKKRRTYFPVPFTAEMLRRGISTPPPGPTKTDRRSGFWREYQVAGF